MEEKKEKKKRKGYATLEEQVLANQRYLEKQEARDKKNRSNQKSACKNFILKTATEDELLTVQEWLLQRKK